MGKVKLTMRFPMQHVDYCPLSVRNYKGKPYANFIDDCSSCSYYGNGYGTDWMLCELMDDNYVEKEPELFF